MAREGLDGVELVGVLAHRLQGSAAYLVFELVLLELAREAFSLHYEIHDIQAFMLVGEVQVESLLIAFHEADSEHLGTFFGRLVGLGQSRRVESDLRCQQIYFVLD